MFRHFASFGKHGHICIEVSHLVTLMYISDKQLYSTEADLKNSQLFSASATC